MLNEIFSVIFKYRSLADLRSSNYPLFHFAYLASKSLRNASLASFLARSSSSLSLNRPRTLVAAPFPDTSVLNCNKKMNQKCIRLTLMKKWAKEVVPPHTVRNLHYLSKNSTLFSRENCRFFWVKNLRKCRGIGLFSCWQLWFHEKNCLKIWVKNSRKCCGLGLCSCWQLWFHEKIF